ISAVSNRFTPASMQISMKRRASSTCTSPMAAKRPSPPRVIVPKLSAETSRPLAPRNRYSIVGLLCTGYPTAAKMQKKPRPPERVEWGYLPDVGGQHLWRAYIVAQHFHAKNDLQVPLLPAVGKCPQHRLQQIGRAQL